MRKYFLFIALISFGYTQAQEKESHKTVTIYSTVENTTNRISPTGTVLFETTGQPYENQICVFVNPNKKFQTLIGIGGAITDASAEVFAKLSKEQQDAFLQSYYSSTEGIGYTLARTNIHSCDFQVRVIPMLPKVIKS